MSGGAICKCPEAKYPIRDRAWVVLQRNCNHSAFSGYRRTWSAWSSITCVVCDATWRTKASYVHQLTKDWAGTIAASRALFPRLASPAPAVDAASQFIQGLRDSAQVTTDAEAPVVRKRQLITFDEATPVDRPLTGPCTDCPWARTALNGWLGSKSPETWLRHAMGEVKVDCHAHKGPQCAGLAIFRANICKLPRDPSIQRLPADPKRVFASPGEFLAHHARPPKRKGEE